MKPVIKYQGGKTKELPLIKEMLPREFDRVVEPFCGGAAVSFGLRNPALLSDINKDVINLYHTIADPTLYPTLQKTVDEIKGFDHDKFASDCNCNSFDSLVSYNSTQLIRDRFKDWNAAEFDLTYTMRSVGDYMKEQQDRKELVLMNYAL